MEPDKGQQNGYTVRIQNKMKQQQKTNTNPRRKQGGRGGGP